VKTIPMTATNARKIRTRHPARMPLGPRKIVFGGGVKVERSEWAAPALGGFPDRHSCLAFRNVKIILPRLRNLPGRSSRGIVREDIQNSRRFNAGQSRKKMERRPGGRLKRMLWLVRFNRAYRHELLNLLPQPASETGGLFVIGPSGTSLNAAVVHPHTQPMCIPRPSTSSA